MNQFGEWLRENKSPRDLRNHQFLENTVFTEQAIRQIWKPTLENNPRFLASSDESLNCWANTWGEFLIAAVEEMNNV